MVDFESNAGLLREKGISVIAASVDDAEQTEALRDGLRLNYVQMASGLDAPAVAAATGAALQTGDRVFLHATGFLLNPDGRVAQSVYASGPIGRFEAGDILKVVHFATNRAR